MKYLIIFILLLSSNSLLAALCQNPEYFKSKYFQRETEPRERLNMSVRNYCNELSENNYLFLAFNLFQKNDEQLTNEILINRLAEYDEKAQMMPYQENEGPFNDYRFRTAGNASWVLTQTPFYNVRLRQFEMVMFYFLQRLRDSDLNLTAGYYDLMGKEATDRNFEIKPETFREDLKNYLIALLEASTPLQDEEGLEELRKSYCSVTQDNDDIDLINNLVKGAKAICVFTGSIFNLESCKKAVSNFIPSIAPRMHLTDCENSADVMTNSKYLAGLRIAALKIIQRIYNPEWETGSVYEDLILAFKSSGMDERTAKNISFKVLGAYGTFGPDIEARAHFNHVTRVNFQHAIPMKIIFMGMSVLDRRAFIQGNGANYSLPKNVKTSCDRGKPYHFWMSAYLSQKLSFQGYSNLISKKIPYLTGVGYQIFSRSFGRDPIELFQHGANESIWDGKRMDMVFNKIGAEYGINTNIDRKFNIDQSFLKLRKKAKRFKALSHADTNNMYKQCLPAFTLRWFQSMKPMKASNN